MKEKTGKRSRRLLRALLPAVLALAILLSPWAAGPAGAAGEITVSFRLIGSTRSTGNIALLKRGLEAATGYLGAEYVTWIPTRTYTLPAGSTVYDLFTQALSDAGLKSVGAEKDYVKTIYAPAVCGGYALSEFTNGKYSGWMYTVDGRHPDVGLTKYTLADGQKVIWHYANDYACEEADDMGGLAEAKEFWNRWLTAPDTAPQAAPVPQPTPAPKPAAPEKKPAAKAVKLNKTKATVLLGKKLTLKATLTPKGAAGTVKWSSSNKKVAAVSSKGVVTAKKKGTAVITAKLSNGKKASCRITVKSVPAKKVKLNRTKATLRKGKKLTLKATVTPKNTTDTLKWTSSNKKVATVSGKGVVTAKKKGKAVITVRTSSGKKSRITVTVK